MNFDTFRLTGVTLVNGEYVNMCVWQKEEEEGSGEEEKKERERDNICSSCSW